MTPEAIKEQILKAEFLRANGRHDECIRLCNEILNDRLDNPEALFLIGHCLLESGKHGLAHAIYMQFLRLKPNVSAGWNNLARCYHDQHLLDEAERCFRRAVKLEPNDYISLANIGNIHLSRAQPRDALEITKKALEIEPSCRTARHNLGLAHLHVKNWAEGWEAYQASVGYNKDRKERVYGDETRWDGAKGKVVVAYGEQGIGDELSFASCVPDLIKDCKETVIECDARLQGLFARSFPSASVYGTRYKDMIDWADRHKIDGRVSFGTLPKFYRNKTEDFPGTPYLVADPERRVQWRALLDSISDKPKVGISWQGGLVKTGRARRSISLETMLPVLRQNFTCISLQYRDAEEDVKRMEEMYDIKVHHWPRAIEVADYDETAALVAELDLVVSVTTAVIHLSGALGVPCLVLTPRHPRWFYGLEGDTVPWYKSVKLIRQKKAGDWLHEVNEAAYQARNFLASKHDGDFQLHGIDGLDRRVA